MIAFSVRAGRRSPLWGSQHWADLQPILQVTTWGLCGAAPTAHFDCSAAAAAAALDLLWAAAVAVPGGVQVRRYNACTLARLTRHGTQVSWQAAAGANASGFEVQRGDGVGGWALVASAVAGSTLLDAAAPPAPPQPLYRVRVLTPQLNGSWSQTQAVAVEAGAGTVRFCAPNGGPPPCGAAALPCANISAALAASAEGDTVALLPGTYSGAGNRELSMGGRNLRVLGLAGAAATVQDCGGQGRGWLFVGGESAARGAALSGLSVLNGRACSGGGLLFANSSAAVSALLVADCVADGGGAPPAGLPNVVLAAGGGVFLSASNASFDGVTLRGNLAGYPGGGGGAYAEQGSSGVWSHVQVLQNGISSLHGGKGGGLKLLTASSPLLLNVTISNNSAQSNGLGGGLWADSGASPQLRDCTVANNTALYGAGIGVSVGVALSCANCSVLGNAAGQDGGGFGAGLGATGAILFSDSTLAGNSAGGRGGGLVMGQGFANVTLLRCAVRNNSAAQGGGVYAQTSLFAAIQSAIESNAALQDGGGLWCGGANASAALLGGSLAGNWAGRDGGGAYADAGCDLSAREGAAIVSNRAGGDGGGLLLAPAAAALLAGARVQGNSAAGSGGGAAVAGGAASAQPAALQGLDCALSGNSAAAGGGLWLAAGAAELSGCKVSGNSAAAGDGGGAAVAGGTATLALSDCALSGNSAAGGGGGVALGAGTLAVAGGSARNNSALRGGAFSLAAPAFALEGVSVTGNAAAAAGGGIYAAVNFSLPQPSLSRLSLSGNAAAAGAALFWLRAASPAAAPACAGCVLAWADAATEAVSAAFSPPPPAAAVAGARMPPFAVALLDAYGRVAATAAGFRCALGGGAPLGSPRGGVLDAPLQLSQFSSADVSNGSAAFGQLSVTGVVGRFYTLSCACGADGEPPLPPIAAALAIAPCPPGSEASPSLTACVACRGTQFNLVSGGQCLPCPLGGNCPPPQDSLWAQPGYWRRGNDSQLLFSCPMPGACLPGPAAGEAACAQGYTGPVCAVCAPDFYPWGGGCKRCSPAFGWLMPLAGALGGLAFLALFALPARADDSDPAVRAKIAITLLQVLGLIKDYALRWRPAFLVKALASFDVLNIGLEVAAPACSAAGLASFYSSFVLYMLIPPALALLCLAVWLAAAAALSSQRHRAARERPLTAFGRVLLPARGALGEAELRRQLETFRTRCSKNFCWLLLLLYPGLCKKIMQLGGTRPLEGGDAFLRASYATQSRVGHAPLPLYRAYSAAAAALALLYVAGIPLFFAAAIRAEQRAHAPPAAEAADMPAAEEALKSDVVYGGRGCGGEDCAEEEEEAEAEAAAPAAERDFMDSYIAFLTAGYRPGVAYWELLEMVRKMAMAAVAVFAVDGAFDSSSSPDVAGALSPVLQPFLGQLITVLHLSLFLAVRPFAKAAHNAVHALGLLLTWAALLVGASLFEEGSQTGAIAVGRQEAVGGVLAALLLAAVLGLVGWAAAAYARQLARILPEAFPSAAQLGKQLSKLGSALRGASRRLSSSSSARSLIRSLSRSASFASPTNWRSRRFSSEAEAAEAARREEFASEGGLERQPRVADGEAYRPTPQPSERQPRVSDGDVYRPTPRPTTERQPRVADGDAYRPTPQPIELATV